jgi:hypothetical protein
MRTKCFEQISAKSFRKLVRQDDGMDDASIEDNE